MQDGSKSQDRIDLNSDEIQYFQRLSLTNCRVYFRYRSRSTAMVKMNQKGKISYECLTCRFCNSNVLETQEHLEICEGTKFERRGLRLGDVMGRVTFWRRMTVKMTQMATVSRFPSSARSDVIKYQTPPLKSGGMTRASINTVSSAALLS